MKREHEIDNTLPSGYMPLEKLYETPQKQHAAFFINILIK